MAKKKNPHAVALGKLGGANMTETERKARAQMAAKTRWDKYRQRLLDKIQAVA